VQLPIRWKGLLVVAMPVITLAATVAIRLPFNQQQQETSVLLARAAETRDMAQELLLALQDVESGVRGYALTRDRAFLARFDNARQTVTPRLTGLGTVLVTPEETRVFEIASSGSKRTLDIASQIVDTVDAGRTADSPYVQVLLGDQKHAMDAVRLALGTLRRSNDARVAESQADLARLRQRLAPVVLITFIGGLAGAIGAGWLFATGISTRVRALEDNAERLARGDRLRYAPSRGRDEIGSLDRALRRASLLLRIRDRELRSLNATLERTVHEQTLLNRELEAFSYSVSHDLRAPLRSIDGFAQALREDWGDRLDETAQDHLSRVRNAAQRMGRLIDDLLKLSRLTRAQIQRSDVDLTALAHEIARELHERNPTRQVAWAIAPGLRAYCDPALARIVLENLLGNAWKFTAKTADARIEFHAVPDSRPPLFVVRDNGAGFDMNYADKLFAPFQRLHGERDFPGTGIGLATVQRIIRKHGGDVRTRAGVGLGATFFFTLEPGDGVKAA
jgi:signal transduction histidine kinase